MQGKDFYQYHAGVSFLASSCEKIDRLKFDFVCEMGLRRATTNVNVQRFGHTPASCFPRTTENCQLKNKHGHGVHRRHCNHHRNHGRPHGTQGRLQPEGGQLGFVLAKDELTDPALIVLWIMAEGTLKTVLSAPSGCYVTPKHRASIARARKYSARHISIVVGTELRCRCVGFEEASNT